MASMEEEEAQTEHEGGRNRQTGAVLCTEWSGLASQSLTGLRHGERFHIPYKICYCLAS